MSSGKSRKCPECGKDGWPSEHEARMGCRTMGNRFRVYPCSTGLFHVTKLMPDEYHPGREKRAKRKRIRNGE